MIWKLEEVVTQNCSAIKDHNFYGFSYYVFVFYFILFFLSIHLFPFLVLDNLTGGNGEY